MTAEQFFRPSILLKDSQGKLSKNFSYNIGSFAELEVIGEGTYGKVYKARLSEAQIQEQFRSDA